ncbi:helix-turn-helix domain-containing protein [Acidisphaera sp. L21]|uniref:helix-turn-helix domain-containing protein n=1 Tax=Acidisphaera sp. L21 TaxID=1641851 RepID=UPI0020B13B0B|nr:AraC family transcriptional regulator [Acidisphaera sp. L21]
MLAGRLSYEDFNRHLFYGDNRPDVHRVLSIRRNGVKRPFAARYILATKAVTVPVASLIDCLVPMVHMAPRPQYNIVYDGKLIHREATALGTFTIRDRRVGQYNDSRVADNVSFYIPMADLADITYKMGASRIEALPTLLDQYCYDPIMFYIAKTMDCALEHPSEVSALFIGHIFEAVCLHIVKTYGGLKEHDALRRGGLSSGQEARVKSMLLDDLTADVSLEDLAVSCGMSERHFARAFKQSTGIPPHRWLLMKRVERAQSMLQNTALQISAIALECGFASQSHLTRVFSKAVGVSPAAWRRHCRY